MVISLINTIAARPVLLQFNVGRSKITLYWYGAFMGLAYCAAILAALSYLEHQHEIQAADLHMYSIVIFRGMFPAAIIGARLLSWIKEDNYKLDMLFRPGFYWHGGLVGVLASLCVSHTLTSVAMLPLLDGMGVAMPLFEIFNRIGCLSYGCCWGKVAPESHRFGVRFTNEQSCIHRKGDDYRKAWLYPVQAYAVVLSIMQFIITLWFATIPSHVSYFGW